MIKQQMMRIVFKDGRPNCEVPYSDANHRQYSKILGNVIRHIEIVEDEEVVNKVKAIETNEKITVTKQELQAMLANMQERGETAAPKETLAPIKKAGRPKKNSTDAE